MVMFIVEIVIYKSGDSALKMNFTE